MRSLLLILLLATSGCMGLLGEERQLSEDEARDVAKQAVERFASDFTSADGGDLKRVRGEFGGASAGFEQVSFEAEWGKDQTARVELTMGGAMAATVSLHCDAQRTVITFGDTRVESRPSPGRSCLDSLQEDSDPLSLEDMDAVEVGNVTAHDDGTVTASFVQDGQEVVAKIDARGRLVRIDFAAQGQEGFIIAEYGARRTIEVPQASQRMPAIIHGAGSFGGQRYSWQATSAQESVPFSEIEVRVVDSSNTTMAAFVPGPGQQTQAGFAFDFTDDGDAMFGEGDAFTIEHPAWTQHGQYDVLVWDVWADREVGDVPIPGPAVLLLGLGLLLLARRR